jgi:hypothetical protein
MSDAAPLLADTAIEQRTAAVARAAWPRLLGAFLIATAWLKILAPADAASSQSPYDLPYWLVVAAIELELVVGLMLLATLWLTISWAAALALFGSFLGVSLLRAAAGLESCGCFGSVHVNPWWTAAFDSAIVAGLWLARRQFFEPSVPARPRRLRVWLVACLAMVAVSLTVLATTRPYRLNGAAPLPNDEKLVILEPSEWTDNPFPLTPYCEPPVDVSQGRWVVVLFHHDCPNCQLALPKYEEFASQAEASDLNGVLAVEIPPFGGEPRSSDAKMKHARLSESREWFVQAPVEVRVVNGIVESASLDLPSLQPK